MTATCELLCLGAPRLLSPGGSDLRLRVKKHLALLVFLAVDSRGYHRRAQLQEMLWSGVPVRQGRQSLATALSVIRARLGKEAVEGDRDRVRLAAGRLRTDLQRLEAGEILGDEMRPPLDVDGFLAGFDLPDAPEFHLWRDRQHARLLPSIQRALVVLIDLARRTGDAPRLVRYADRLLGIDDLSEEGIRARMESCALLGDRVSALRAYEDWVERLAGELGATPSPFLEGMAMRLRRRGWERPGGSDVPAVRTEQWRARPFVGRTREYRVLYESWERVQKAEASHALLIGDSGVGKTTLADRLATVVGLEGGTVARVRCFELERGIPYAAVGGLVTILVERPGAAATSPRILAELGRIVPEVRRRFTDLPEPIEVQGEAARIRFADAAEELLLALMEEHPVLLIVDDYHMADGASLAVLHLLLRRLQDRPFMVVFTSIGVLPPEAANAARIRDNAKTLAVTPVEVGPMAREDSETLLDAIVGGLPRRPTVTERRALLRAAAGYPMALEMLVRDWVEHGPACLALALGAMTETMPPMEVTYERLAEGIQRDLDASTRMVLHLAALLDRRLNELEMYELVDLTTAQTLGGLTQLVSRHALRDAGTGLEFANQVFRGCAYFGIPGPLRKILHGKVADLLLERLRLGKEVPGLEVAWHCFRAGRSEEATPHLLRGAREALMEGAPHEAELALTSGMPGLPASTRPEAQLLLVEALQELGQWNRSLETLEATPASREVGHEALASLFEVEARRNLGYIRRDDYLGHAHALSRTILKDPSSPLAPRAAVLAASLLEELRLPHESSLLLDSVSLIVPDGLPSVDTIRLLLAKAMLSYQTRELSEASDLARAAEELVRANRINNSLAVRLFVGFGALACASGHYDAALLQLDRAHRIAIRLGSDSQLATVAANIALCHCRLGAYSKVEGWALRAYGIANTHDAHPTMVQALCYLGLSRAMLGTREKAIEVLDLLKDRFQSPDVGWLSQWSLLIRADVQQLLGNQHQAHRLAAMATSGRYSVPLAASHVGAFCRWLAVRGLAEKSPEHSATRLAEFARNRVKLDALDRAEVLLAMGMLEPLEPELHNELKELFAVLPPAVVDQLTKLTGPGQPIQAAGRLAN